MYIVYSVYSLQYIQSTVVYTYRQLTSEMLLHLLRKRQTLVGLLEKFLRVSAYLNNGTGGDERLPYRVPVPPAQLDTPQEAPVLFLRPPPPSPLRPATAGYGRHGGVHEGVLTWLAFLTPD